MAREITYKNFEISLVVFMPNITEIILLPIQKLTTLTPWKNQLNLQDI